MNQNASLEQSLGNYYNSYLGRLYATEMGVSSGLFEYKIDQ